jgi:hypothetical protein
MGILSNTVSICQFRVIGDLPRSDLFEWVSSCLQRQGFRSIDQGLEELSTGWVHLANSQESSFAAPADFWHDRYLAFSFRQDRRRVPASLFKAYMQVAEHEFLAANPGYSRVSKQKREELKETVRGRLLARTLPVPSIQDVVWDTENGLVTYTSLAKGSMDEFEALFKKSFPGFRLQAVHPFARAEQVVKSELKSALATCNRATSETVLDLITSNRWIGWDFLLWVMYRTLNGTSEYRICSPGPDELGRPFTAYINDRLVLCGTGDIMQKVTVAGPQDRFSEVCTALGQGKVIKEAAIHFEKGDDLWKLSLKGEMFQFASFKSPKVKEERDNTVDRESEREALFFERMMLLESGLQLFDSLFASFLNIRLGAQWQGELERIEEWLKSE